MTDDDITAVDALSRPANQPHPRDGRPTVPVLYDLPPEAADRAIERFRTAQAADGRSGPVTLTEYIFDEVEQKPVFLVDGQPLDEYAADSPDPEDADGLESQVLTAIQEAAEPRGFDELADAVDADADELGEAIDSLIDNYKVRYSGRRGGYALVNQ